MSKWRMDHSCDKQSVFISPMVWLCLSGEWIILVASCQYSHKTTFTGYGYV